jgi:hypothetical protein
MLNGNPETDPSAVKLGDFGLGLIVDNDAAYSTYVGTVSYMAPVRVIAWRRIGHTINYMAGDQQDASSIHILDRTLRHFLSWLLVPSILY